MILKKTFNFIATGLYAATLSANSQAAPFTATLRGNVISSGSSSLFPTGHPVEIIFENGESNTPVKLNTPASMQFENVFSNARITGLNNLITQNFPGLNSTGLYDQEPQVVNFGGSNIFTYGDEIRSKFANAEGQAAFTATTFTSGTLTDDPTLEAPDLGLNKLALLDNTQNTTFGSMSWAYTDPVHPAKNYFVTILTVSVDGLTIDLPPIPGDFNNDRAVNGNDLTIWKNNFGSLYDGSDFLTWQRNFTPPSTTHSTPEPSTVFLTILAAGATFCLGRNLRNKDKAIEIKQDFDFY